MERKHMFVLFLAFVAFSDNVIGLSISGNATSDVQCGFTCGAGAHCITNITMPVCVCLPGLSGNPLSQCTTTECILNSSCRNDENCVNRQCVNSCEGACGTNATCVAINHAPVCSCPDGYTGDPQSSCTML